MSKRVTYAKEGFVAGEKVDNFGKYSYENRVFDAFARLLEVRGVAVAAVAPLNITDKTLAVTFNISTRTKDKNEISELILKNKKEIKEIHEALKNLYSISKNSSYSEDFANDFQKNFLKILFLKQHSLDKETRDKFDDQNDGKKIENFEDFTHLMSAEIKKHLYSGTKLYLDVVKVIAFYTKKGIFPEISIFDNKYNVHAENFLAAKFEEYYNNKKLTPEERNTFNKYIGISKLACHDCDDLLTKGGFEHRGKHGVLYHSYYTSNTSKSGLYLKDLKWHDEEVNKKYKPVKADKRILEQDNSGDELDSYMFEPRVVELITNKSATETFKSDRLRWKEEQEKKNAKQILKMKEETMKIYSEYEKCEEYEATKKKIKLYSCTTTNSFTIKEPDVYASIEPKTESNSSSILPTCSSFDQVSLSGEEYQNN